MSPAPSCLTAAPVQHAKGHKTVIVALLAVCAVMAVGLVYLGLMVLKQSN